MTQPALDLWPTTPSNPDPHQRGHVQLPHDTQQLGPAGTLTPGWVCCACGGVEVTGFALAVNHGCCRGYLAICETVPARRRFGLVTSGGVP